jgi:predicted metal-dependent enzyme (double-stranded beta helix superfamily)
MPITHCVPIQSLVDQLRQLPTESFSRLDDVHDLLRTSPVEPESLQPFLTWDRQHYTRNLIDKTPLYELVAICWEIGQHSSIHNHHEQNCWMAVPIGRLLVQNYRVRSEDLGAGTCDLEPTNVVEMNPEQPCAVDPAEPVHKVFNPTSFKERAVSLHVYSRPIPSCIVYSLEQHKCGEIKLSYTTEYGQRVS